MIMEQREGESGSGDQLADGDEEEDGESSLELHVRGLDLSRGRSFQPEMGNEMWIDWFASQSAESVKDLVSEDVEESEGEKVAQMG